MKTTLVFVISVLLLAVTATGISWYLDIGGFSAQQKQVKRIDPDIPNFLQNEKANYSKEDFLRMRSRGVALKRGIKNDQPFDPAIRTEAVNKMKRQEDDLRQQAPSAIRDQFLASWTPIGPAPIPNGQVPVGPATPVSGRVTAIAIPPTNPNIVYVGAAQGGIYRSTDGGTNWTPIFDSAQSIAIGALALAPTSPDTLYVGTGEPNFSIDSFFGVGVYRIDNASTTATLNGPFGGAQFSGRSISEIIVHPTVA